MPPDPPRPESAPLANAASSSAASRLVSRRNCASRYRNMPRPKRSAAFASRCLTGISVFAVFPSPLGPTPRPRARALEGAGHRERGPREGPSIVGIVWRNQSHLATCRIVHPQLVGMGAPNRQSGAITTPPSTSRSAWTSDLSTRVLHPRLSRETHWLLSWRTRFGQVLGRDIKRRRSVPSPWQRSWHRRPLRRLPRQRTTLLPRGVMPPTKGRPVGWAGAIRVPGKAPADPLRGGRHPAAHSAFRAGRISARGREVEARGQRHPAARHRQGRQGQRRRGN